MTGADHEQLLDLIYRAAFEPDAWYEFMERFADAIGATSAWLSEVNLVDNSAGGIISRLDPRMRQIYLDHFADRNPLSNVPDPCAYVRGWMPKILTDEDWMAKDDLVASEYYNDFLKPQGVHTTMMIRLSLDGYDLAVLNVNRPSHWEPFGAAEREFAASLHPHLIRAFRLSRTAAGLGLADKLAAAHLAVSAQAIFILSKNGLVKSVNAAAERLVERGELQLVGGRLCSGDRTRRLEGLIAGAVATDPSRRGAGSMALPRACGRPLSVTVSPLRSDELSDLMAGPAAVVCVTDLDAEMTLSDRRLRDLFGLTGAEAGVAKALFEGMSTREAAENLGVSFFTVRAHLRNICEKTGTRSQVDLARLLSRLGLPGEMEGAAARH